LKARGYIADSEYRGLMSHRVDDKIDPETESFYRRLQGIRALIDIVPEVFQIVVIAGDYADLSVPVHQRVENRFAVHEIRRCDIQGIDIEEGVENLVIDRQPYKVAVRECPVQVALQGGEISRPIEVVHHDKSATVDILPQVVYLMLR